MTPRVPETLDILGVPLTALESYDHTVECVAAAVAARERLFCVAINPEKVYWARRNPALLEAIRRAQLCICDGVGAAWAARMLHGRRVTRITGVDLFKRLMSVAGPRGWKVFLLGASEDSSRRAAEGFARLWPEARIVGRCNGFFTDSDAVVNEINASGADLLFVAMGSPRQELWITQHRERLNCALCMGVGGTLDVFSGAARRAPEIWRKLGVEFLYRLVTEPKRARRQWVLPLFGAAVLRTIIFGGPRRDSRSDQSKNLIEGARSA